VNVGCDDREISNQQDGIKNRMPLISSFASADTSIQKVTTGFALWHPDSHFGLIFESLGAIAILERENSIWIQHENRAAAARRHAALSLNPGSVRGTWSPRVPSATLTTVVP
jgi:hypothetical protein